MEGKLGRIIGRVMRRSGEEVPQYDPLADPRLPHGETDIRKMLESYHALVDLIFNEKGYTRERLGDNYDQLRMSWIANDLRNATTPPNLNLPGVVIPTALSEVVEQAYPEAKAEPYVVFVSHDGVSMNMRLGAGSDWSTNQDGTLLLPPNAEELKLGGIRKELAFSAREDGPSYMWKLRDNMNYFSLMDAGHEVTPDDLETHPLAPEIVFGMAELAAQVSLRPDNAYFIPGGSPVKLMHHVYTARERSYLQ